MKASLVKMAVPISNEMSLDTQARDTLETVTSMTASELNSMTSAERTYLLEDVHGVGDVSPEETDPKIMRERLYAMDIALQSIPNKPAFNEAQCLCGGSPGGFVNDPNFRVKFLRAERYKPYQAAKRMVHTLQVTFETFGRDSLVRPICLSDMMLDKGNQGTDTFLFSGNYFQVMPFRDRVGRRIVVRSGREIFSSDQIDNQTRLKAFLYICQQLSDDVECQLKGVVLMAFPLERTNKIPTVDQNVKLIFRMVSNKIVPVRISAVHICVQDSPWFRLASSLIIKAFPREFRIRTRVHIGSVEECCYKLMAYGIPSDQIPITSSGIIKCADHKKFIAYCQEREDAMLRNGENFKVIFCPSSKDVLVGRGPRIKSHIGNEVYRDLLRSKYEEYNSVSVTKKKEISFDIIRKVHAYGGRFLLPISIGWVETDDETARSKVSIAFRDVRKAINATMNRKYGNSVATEISVHEGAQMNFFGCVKATAKH